MSTKAALRKRLRSERLALSHQAVYRHSQIIVAKLLHELQLRDVSSVHCFTSVAELNEIETSSLFAYLWREFPSIVTYTTQKVDEEWLHGQFKPDGSFEPQMIALPSFDVIIVPMLGFDGQLHRLGHGGGFYDKFLASQPQAQKIGLCYEQGRVASMTVEPHDIPMSMVITEVSVTAHYPKAANALK